MQSIFEEIALWSNKNVTKESSKMLSELRKVKYFHLQCRVRDCDAIL